MTASPPRISRFGPPLPVFPLLLLLLSLLAVGGPAACNGILFGRCEVRLVEVTGPYTWRFENTTTEDGWFDRLAETNLPPGAFDPIADAFDDATGVSGQQLSWLVRAFDTIPGWVGVRVEVPVRSGDRIPVTGVSEAGGFDLRPGQVDGALVDVRLGDFRATEADGELVVLSASPLRVRMELTATDASGKALDLSGVMEFRVFVEERQCD